MLEKEICINGLDINYKIAGEGQPILILHGWGGSSKSFSIVQEILAENGFQVITLDLPGFGKSQEPKEVWNLDDYGDFVLKFIEIFGYEKVVLIGHSFGGRIAIKFAAKYPEKIKGLILISTPGIKPKKGLKEILATILAKLMGPFSFLPGFNFLRTIFYKNFLKKTDYLKTEGIMKDIFKEIIKEDLESLLPDIKTKTFIIWGKEDKITPLKDGLMMKEKIPNSEIVVLEGTGHAPNLKAPEKLSKAIIEFLKQ